MKTDRKDREPARILVVDDEEAIREIFQMGIIQDGYECETAPSGLAALEMMKEQDFDVVITDIQMPGLSGIELVRRIKLTEKYDSDVIVMTGFFENFEYVEIIELGAKDFIQKPVRLSELLIRLRRVLHERSIVRERNYAFGELRESYLDTLNRLAVAAEYKDEDTGDHILRISEYCPLMAAKIGMSSEDILMIRYASPMHDVGKIGIPDRILLKPGKLNDREFDIMRKHTLIGGRILENSKSAILELARIIAVSHHEKWNGKGYPAGLSKEEIPVSGRIVAIADTFDALVSRRPYKDPYPIEVAFDIIRREREKHFDPQLVDIFIKHFDEFLAIKTQISSPEENPVPDFRWSERDMETFGN